jgi:hypothetical protein
MREDHVAEIIPDRKKKAAVLHLIFLLKFIEADCMAAKVGVVKNNSFGIGGNDINCSDLTLNKG